MSDYGHVPVRAKGPKFTKARIPEAETRRMPVFALHDLAYAYDDRLPGFDGPQVIAAFEEMKADGPNDMVEQKASAGGVVSTTHLR